MLVTNEAWENKLVNRVVRRQNLQPADRCFRYIEVVEEPRLFIVDLGLEKEAGILWTHFIIVRLDDLLQVLENAETTKSTVRITLQTAFSPSEPYQLSEITRIVKRHDGERNEIIVYQCKNGATYTTPLNAPSHVGEGTVLWP